MTFGFSFGSMRNSRSTSARFTHHAIDRYVERVRPGLDRETAEKELNQFLANGVFVISDDPPNWKNLAYEGSWWLLLGDDVAFPCQHDIALTCITSTELPPEIRETRNRAHARRRAARKFKQATSKPNNINKRPAYGGRRQGREKPADGSR